VIISISWLSISY